MKRMFGVSATLLVAATAAAGEFEDFRVPDHSWKFLSTSVSASADRDRYGEGFRVARNSSASTSLTGRGQWARDGEALQYSVDAGLALGGFRADSRDQTEYRSDVTYSLDRSHRHEERVGEQVSLAGTLRAYPGPAALGVELGLQALAVYGQTWYRATRDGSNLAPGVNLLQLGHDGRRDSRYQYSLRLQGAIGWGRVRDATGVLDAHVLEQRLLETGALTRALTPAARAKLAAIVYLTPRYSAAHDRPARFVWRDIERVLRDDGALRAEGLDASSTLRGREGYVLRWGRVGPLRAAGAFVGPVLAGVHVHDIVRQEGTSDFVAYQDDTLAISTLTTRSDRLDRWSDYVAAGARAEYHRPLGWRWQFDAGAQVLAPVAHAKNGLEAAMNASCNYLIADRWQASASATYERVYFSPEGTGTLSASDYWSSNLDLSLDWYVEDRTSLYVQTGESQSRGAFYFGNEHTRHGSVRLGVRFMISGRLDAPGWIDPVRHGP